MKYNKAVQKCYFSTKCGKPFYLYDNWLQQSTDLGSMLPVTGMAVLWLTMQSTGTR
jgi:hypothetical protein